MSDEERCGWCRKPIAHLGMEELYGYCFATDEEECFNDKHPETTWWDYIRKLEAIIEDLDKKLDSIEDCDQSDSFDSDQYR